MILWPFRRRAERRTIAALYGAIVTQARCTALYANFGVADTVQGRFDLIVLHLVLLLRRLGENDTGQALGQRLFDKFCRDLDDNLREMGIGDLAVPKHMRRFGEAFYGRQAAYLAALEAEEGTDFENALARNIFQVMGPDERAVRLGRYARAVLQELDVQEHGSITRGEVAFPKPEAFANVRA